MGVLHGNPFLLASGTPTEPAVPLQRSVRLRSSNSASFSRTPASAGSQTTWTWSAWIKRGLFGAARPFLECGTSGAVGLLSFTSSDQLSVTLNSSVAATLVTSSVYRDPSAWYHVIIVTDTTQAKSSNRCSIFVNGVQVTAFASTNYPTQNSSTQFNRAAQTTIGYSYAAVSYFDGYLTEVNFVDGQALTPSSFGGYNAGTNVWEVRKYSGTYGTNGFYLPFTNPASIGADGSGNGNNWTPNGIQISNSALTTYDSMLDVPTNTGSNNANFATLNPIAGQGNGTYSEGTLAYLNGVSVTWKSGVASMGVTSGKYYFEYTIAAVSNSSNFYLGVAGSTYNGFASYLGRTSDSWAFQWNGASSVKTNNDVSTTVSTAGSISVNDVIQVAIDLGTGSIWWGRNNTWVQGDPSAGTGASFTNLTGTILPAFAVYSNSGDKIAANFGQRPFAFTPPSGFKSLNTYNLPEPTIPRGDKYFEQFLYTGNGGGQQIGEIQKPASLFNLDRSLRFRSANTAFLSRTPASAGNRQIFTYSEWVKRGTFGAKNVLFAANTGNESIRFNSSEQLEILIGNAVVLTTTQVFRDPSIWYHIVVAIDTTQATTSNRIKIYVNGIQVTTFSVSTYVTQNTTTGFNATVLHWIGNENNSGYYDGFKSDIYFINGQQLAATDFGAFDGNNYWTPKAYTGTYGTNGFHLEFEDFSNNTATTIGKDTSGQGNNWTPNGIVVSPSTSASNDSMVDVPTLTSAEVANFTTLNPLVKGTPSAGVGTISQGNLNWACSNNSAVTVGTIEIPKTGKWYWEVVVPTQTYNFCMVGVFKDPQLATLTGAVGTFATGYAVYSNNGQKYNNSVSSAYMAITAQNTVMTIAFDADTGSLYVGAGGSWANGAGLTNQTWANAVAAYTGLTTGGYYPAISMDTGNGNINFGQRPFTHTPPTGYKSLNSFNVAEVVGDVETPDLVWIKSRSAGTHHALFNSVVGTGKYLQSSGSVIEVADVNSLIQFNKNGFLLGNAAIVNASAATFVASAWKAGNTTVTNTAGTISSQVKANQEAGFSIITFTTNNTAGATVGHGLGVIPAMIIMKYRTLASTNWVVYHKNMSTTPQTGYLNLSATTGFVSSTDPWNNTAPTSSVITMGAGVGSSGSTNYSVQSSVAYCFSEIEGYSKFGSYTANNDPNGPFVYTGFRPRWLIVKRATTGTTGGWFMYDTARNTFNVMDKYLFAEGAAGDATLAVFDFTSNGFKIRSNNVHVNSTAGNTYIYMAFAENPFKYALAR